jgi:dihydrofolate synthase/folylpolyglutamate synthase
VGLTTSPHLVSFRERIRVDGQPIPTEAVQAFITRYRPQLEDWGATYFEIVTAMALWHFAESGCRIAVLETGLGGRLDATNAINTDIAILTSIALDHVDVLGGTLESVFAEKLGILKPGKPVVCGPLPENLEPMLAAKAQELNCPVRRVGTPQVSEEETWTLPIGSQSLVLPHDFRSASHAWANLALALNAYEMWKNSSLPPSNMWLSTLSKSWAGRMQWLRKPGLSFLLDGAHNPAGLEALVSHARHALPEYRWHAVVSMMADKDILTEAKLLGDWATSGVFVDMRATYARAASPEVFLSALPSAYHSRWRILPLKDLTLADLRPPPLDYEKITGIQNSIKQNSVRESSAPKSAGVICGSLYLLGEALPLLWDEYPELAEFKDLQDPPS